MTTVEREARAVGFSKPPHETLAQEGHDSR